MRNKSEGGTPSPTKKTQNKQTIRNNLTYLHIGEKIANFNYKLHQSPLHQSSMNIATKSTCNTLKICKDDMCFLCSCYMSRIVVSVRHFDMFTCT